MSFYILFYVVFQKITVYIITAEGGDSLLASRDLMPFQLS